MGISIRCWQEGDCQALARNADDPRIAERLRDTFPSPYTEEDAAFFINLARRTTDDSGWIYAITKDDEVVGGISLTFGSDVYARSAELGYWIGTGYWGHGIATEAVQQICERAFRETDVLRIEAEVFSDNPGSIRVLEKNHFIREGYFCQRVYKCGRMLDSVLFACFK